MNDLIDAHKDHRRTWSTFHYCYPVISRRSRGVSLGVNLNPDKLCSFDCVYCEVDRLSPPRTRSVDLDRLMAELEHLVDLTLSGELFQSAPFASVPGGQRRFNDIAFSGDGEPTAQRLFSDAVARVVELRRRRGLDEVKLVLITNSTRLMAPEVAEGIDLLMANGGEVWAKLDAGTEAHYRDVNRSKVPFSRILQNLAEASRRWPITIQTMFLEWKGQGPSEGELAAYLECLHVLRDGGGRMRGVQLYTVARPTPEAEARPLADAALDSLADRVRAALPGIEVDVFHGSHASPLA